MDCSHLQAIDGVLDRLLDVATPALGELALTRLDSDEEDAVAMLVEALVSRFRLELTRAVCEEITGP